MTDTFAAVDDLAARLSSAYSVPDDAAVLLVKASELVDFATMGRAQAEWDDDPESAASLAVTQAVCDQVEFWLEVGEETDVAGLTGSLQGGRVQISRLPSYLGRRAMRTLLAAGLYWAGGGVV